MNQGGEVERDGHHVAVRGRVSLASFRVKRIVLARNFRELDVDVSSTISSRFATDSVANP